MPKSALRFTATLRCPTAPTGALSAGRVIAPPFCEGDSHAPHLTWLRRLAGRGATIIGICDGVRAVASTGRPHGQRDVFLRSRSSGLSATEQYLAAPSLPR